MKISQEETELDWPIYVKAWREQVGGMCDIASLMMKDYHHKIDGNMIKRNTSEEFYRTNNLVEIVIGVGENFPDTKESMIQINTIILKQYPGYMRKGHMNRERKKYETRRN